MADEASKEKSLEMRVAELEDKLSKVHITEDELKAYHKVSAALGGTATSGPQACIAASCVVDCVNSCINECAIRSCVIRCIIRQCTIIIRQCTFECGGGCAPGGQVGGFLGGQFGEFGG